MGFWFPNYFILCLFKILCIVSIGDFLNLSGLHRPQNPNSLKNANAETTKSRLQLANISDTLFDQKYPVNWDVSLNRGGKPQTNNLWTSPLIAWIGLVVDWVKIAYSTIHMIHLFFLYTIQLINRYLYLGAIWWMHVTSLCCQRVLYSINIFSILSTLCKCWINNKLYTGYLFVLNWF